MRLSDDELAALEAAITKATPGPWEAVVRDDDGWLHRAVDGPNGVEVCEASEFGDMRYIAFANPECIGRLLADLRTIGEMLELLRKLATYAGHREWCDLDQAYGTHECTCGYGDIASAIPS